MTHQEQTTMNNAMAAMTKGLAEAVDYVRHTREIVAAVHIMVNDVERAAACRCSHRGTCSTCQVWMAHDAYETWLLATDTGVDSPPGKGATYE